jgi:hypothetical protein
VANEAVNALGSVYQRFSEREAVNRSPLYVEICRGIADDQALLLLLAALPLEKQQPNLLLAAVKYRHGVARDFPHFRGIVLGDWRGLLAVILARRTQTNEPARCATLLPVLAMLPQPLALIEVGASAGLCLLPDYYAYDYDGRAIAPGRPSGSPPLFRCFANAATPVPARNVEVAWRAGLDLNPLDPADPDDARWLAALIWPGEGDRQRLLDQTLAVARAYPPRLVQGDLRQDLPRLAAEAPKDATLVVFHTAVLAYVREQADRRAFAETVRTLGAQWISNESAEVYNVPGQPPAPWGSFTVSLNGKPLAHADPHGKAIEWLGRQA